MENKLNKVSCKCCKCGIKRWTNYECKCGQMVCLTHRYFYEHDCTHDVRKEWGDKIEEKNPKINNPKVIHI